MAIVHVSPAAGAGFTQYTAELEPEGHWARLRRSALSMCWRAAADLATESSFRTLTAGGYAYFPEGTTHTITAQERRGSR